MTRLIHLTDLHFGAERVDLLAPLVAALRHCDADFIVVSGDLTHRARPEQFRAAMAFLAHLQKPTLTVPGNHDVPLWNFPLRFIDPFRRYRMGTVPVSRSAIQVGRFRLFHANTADPYRWRSGVLREDDVLRVERQLKQATETPQEESVLNVLVCHHPIEEPPGFDRGETRGASEGILRLVNACLHVVLTGHLHHWQIGLGITARTPHRLLQIQSGTALCGRAGEKKHGFAVLDLEDDRLIITPWIIDEAAVQFRPAAPAAFRKEQGLWHILPGSDKQDVQAFTDRTAVT
ncbi:metallophosphoesterase [Castellaniella sp.]|uniref:metallophosphoesterase family protein n=1 Tax=Castellaniella sp. TaxID=1955812 RepID=UPI002AFF0997|nr:metallophosphoesterase [Castellaniella sp.]